MNSHHHKYIRLHVVFNVGEIHLRILTNVKQVTLQKAIIGVNL